MFSFLSAVFLWGLPLAAVPVAIHLLARRRRRVLPWGAMLFLRDAAARKRRLWKLDDRSLMLLRALAVVVLILALARPTVRSAWFGGSETRELVVLVDDSMSTARTLPDGGGTVHDAIRRETGRLIGGLRAGDRVRVMTAASPSRWLTDEPITIGSDSTAALADALGDMVTTLGSADWLACTGAALAGSDTDPDVHERVIVAVTDGRSHGWRPDAVRSWSQLKRQVEAAEPATTLAVLDVTARDAPGGAAAAPKVNLSVDSVTSRWPITGRGEPMLLTAVVRNTGTQESPLTSLHWLEGDRLSAVSPIEPIEPGRSVTVTTAHAFNEAGVVTVTARIEAADALDPDNTARVVIEVVEAIPVLVVDGSTRSDPFDAQGDYLLAALGGGPDESPARRFGAFLPAVIRPSELNATQLAEYPAVICLEDVRFAPADLQRLADFVQGGGGLWIVAGPRTAPDAFNAALATGRGGLSPVLLGEPVGNAHDRERFERIRPPSGDHPATVLLADTDRLDIDRGCVYRRFPMERSVGDASMAILLATDAGSPLVVEKALGRGRVLVQAVPMNASWSNLPLCQAYVVMVQEWLWYLVEPSFPRWNLDPGQGLVVSREVETALPAEMDVALVTSPGGRLLRVEGRREEGRRLYRFARTYEPGPYRLAVPSPDGQREEFPFEVRRDPAESDLTPLSDDQRDALAEVGGWRFVTGPLSRAWRIDDGPRTAPIWTHLLLGLLALWAIELILAGHLTRRRRQASAPFVQGESDLSRTVSRPRSAVHYVPSEQVPVEGR